MNRITADPRVGPFTSLDGRLTIWVRRIGAHHITFWSWPDRLEIHRIPENSPAEHLHTFHKES